MLKLGTDIGGSEFPFNGPAYTVGLAGTEYQEAYSSSDFSGPISITGIDFFVQADGALFGATYQLSLSIITANINSLSDTNLAGNLGADNTVFTTVSLGGLAPNTLTFNGGPFYYDPSLGNLLLDIQISNVTSPIRPPEAPPASVSFWDGGGMGPAGIIRYTNFGGGTTGYGLVTEFDFPTVPESGTLILAGCALGGLLLICRRSRFLKEA